MSQLTIEYDKILKCARKKLFHPERSLNLIPIAKRLVRRDALKVLRWIEENPQPLPILIKELRHLLQCLEAPLRIGYSPFERDHVLWVQKIDNVQSWNKSKSYIYAEFVGPKMSFTVFNQLRNIIESQYGFQVREGEYMANILSKGIPIGKIFYDEVGGIKKHRLIARMPGKKIVVNYWNTGLIINTKITCNPNYVLDEILVPLKLREQEFVNMVMLTPKEFFSKLRESLSSSLNC